MNTAVRPSLPQKDPNSNKRNDYLERNREDYQFDRSLLPPLPFMQKVPKREYFSPEYTAKRLASMANLPANMLAAKAKRFLDPLDSLEEYEELIPLLSKPNLLKNYRTDEFFGEQRLSGANAMATRRLAKLPSDFAVDNALFQQVLETDGTLDAALAEGRLYFLEHPYLNRIKGGESEYGRKYMPKTRSLFYWKSDDSPVGGALLPVAIELKSEATNTPIVYTPKDAPLDWLFAKLCVQVADANHQELGSHFAFTHTAMGPFAMVTARQLAENHPVSLLLEPHFQFMLFDNDLGRAQFLNPGGPVDRFLAGTLEETLTFVVDTLDRWSIDTFDFPSIIERQNMDDPEVLPHYPFRDDGMLIWDAVKEFITNYLSIYYKTPEDIREDYELQNWAKELAAFDSGRVKGMPETIESLQQLIDILSVVIFTCAPLHSNLNFTQYEYMIFVPNMPYAAYHPVPEQKGIDMETILKFLPPYKQAADQVYWTMVLTSYHHDKLGFYEDDFADPLAQDALVQFQQNLADIERKIEIENQHRPVPYQYFLPSEIINSINT
ncbi:lipoxygenase family protein [Synechococcus sp. PCC 7336]|uniref:lipoxygenase family protein n=1 Tax=Synechococcus sp. PCC 7336 TaxID=195250 RepID=UPI0003498887|nr:lipoxygenase family protein [Synechococcus sp. PCC 7336]